MGAERDALDRALDRNHRLITIRRVVGQSPNAIVIDAVDVRAAINNYEPEDLVGDIQQGTSKVIMSPTDLERQQWPGGLPPTAKEKDRYPLNGDLAIVDGKARKINGDAELFKIGAEVVRLEFDILG
jgi:hypothetical protein